MNLPSTIRPEQTGEAVAAFAPRMVHPYHHRGSDPGVCALEQAARAAGTEVIRAAWHPTEQCAPGPEAARIITIFSNYFHGLARLPKIECRCCKDGHSVAGDGCPCIPLSLYFAPWQE